MRMSLTKFDAHKNTNAYIKKMVITQIEHFLFKNNTCAWSGSVLKVRP